MPQVLRDNWILRMTQAMSLTHPEVSKERIEQIVTKIYNERVKDTQVQIYNNYENYVANSSLVEVVDWLHDSKPLIAESGVYFHQKSKKRNVNVEIIKECMLDARTIHKREKFEAMQAGDTFLAAVKDIQQANDKKAANSGYGAEGQSSSFLYNIHSAMSVTSCGRGQISTACQCFENLLADNVKFYHMTEFFNWIYNITHEESEWKFDTFEVVPYAPTRDEYIERFLRKFGHETLADLNMIGSVYDSLSDEMQIRTYYKSNLKEFLLLRKTSDLYDEIANTDVDYVDPNKIPDELKKPLGKLTDLVMEFVGYKYSVFRYEDRTKYLKREICIVIDTDSYVCIFLLTNI